MIDLYLQLLKKAKTSLLLSICLFPLAALSIVFQVIVSVRRSVLTYIAKNRRVAAPVITVGNLVVGGTGKTPFIALLLDHLQDLRVGYVSRGYKRKEHCLYMAQGAKTTSHLDRDKAGDEAILIASGRPYVKIAVADEKWDAVRAVQDSVDVIILDDGLQRHDIPMVMKIAMIDAGNPDGYGWLLPRGLLREPMSYLRFVDYIVVTNGDLSFQVPRPVIKATSQLVGFISLGGATLIPGQDVALFSAIANPERFRTSIERLGFRVVKHAVFPDHAHIPEDYLQRFAEQCPDIPLIGTEKDYSRQSFPDMPLSFAKMRLVITEGEELFAELIKKIRGYT